MYYKLGVSEAKLYFFFIAPSPAPTNEFCTKN